MKNLLLTAICIFIYIGTFAQFGGGTGTESDPYRLYTIVHLKEIGDSMVNGNHLRNIHFRLMNDIVDDSITNTLGGYWNSHYGQNGFGGSLHGGGHTVALSIETDHDREGALFSNIESTGYVDSLSVVGKLFTSSSPTSDRTSAGICINNQGTIYQCVSKLQVGHIDHFGGIAGENRGNIISCTNYTNTSYSAVGGICSLVLPGSNIVDCVNYGNFKIYGEDTGGICAYIYNEVNNYEDINMISCTNYGNISYVNSYGAFSFNVGGIIGECNIDARYTICTIKNCQNFGTLQADSSIYVGGIVGGEIIGTVFIENCANYGDVIGKYNVGGIAGEYWGNDPLWVINEGYTYPTGRIVNCYNFGYIQGETAVGGIAGSFASYCGDTLAHCLNIGKVEGSAICSGNYDYEGWDLGDSIYYDSNYYDAQMLADTSANEEGMYEWKFTSQLTGDTPELRAMLGDGWSYAEGRYPIPLGLENDSLAMLFATPIYLRVINDDNYDHTNLVRNNFTVGTENGVSWSSGDRLSIDGENATILTSGSETATASLAGYSFSRSLRLDPITGELVATDCDSYLWNGDEYTASGDYIQVLTASNGCDSIVTLHLTINNSVHYSFTETANSPYIWNGIEYTETGDYTQNFTSVNGCDSIVTLHLNILSGISQDGTAEISIFPNPATDILNITSSETISEIEIVNVMGQVLKRMEVNADNVVCYVEDLKAGVYVVRIHAGGTVVSQRKFVKK